MYSKEEAKKIYLQKIEERTNRRFDINHLPGGIRVALDRYMHYDPDMLMVASQSLNDMSTSYNTPDEFESLISRDLEPYTGMHLSGTKVKRKYRRYYDKR